jgi:hypothetical protein
MLIIAHGLGLSSHHMVSLHHPLSSISTHTSCCLSSKKRQALHKKACCLLLVVMYKMGILTIIDYATKIVITKLLNLILEFVSLTNSLFNVQALKVDLNSPIIKDKMQAWC